MIALDNDEYRTASESEGQHDNDDDMPELEDADEEVDASNLSLVIRCTLSTQLVDESELEQQRENIFHFRAIVKGKVCSLIIGGEVAPMW